MRHVQNYWVINDAQEPPTTPEEKAVKFVYSHVAGRGRRLEKGAIS